MGGKGGPLAFLNKKPWHPLNLRNQEEIWKREQAYLAELEKRDQLVKQIEEEREEEDNITQFQRHKLGDQRVEWMYQGGFAAQEDAEKKKEEYLLGKTVDKLPEQPGQEEAPSRVDEVAQGVSAAQPRSVEFTANETWSRLNADPMLMMKKREMDKLKQLQEKIKIARMQTKIQLRAAAKASGTDMSKKAKKHKKDKKHKKEKQGTHAKTSKRRRAESDSGSASPSVSASPPPRPPPSSQSRGSDDHRGHKRSSHGHVTERRCDAAAAAERPARATANPDEEDERRGGSRSGHGGAHPSMHAESGEGRRGGRDGHLDRRQRRHDGDQDYGYKGHRNGRPKDQWEQGGHPSVDKAARRPHSRSRSRSPHSHAVALRRDSSREPDSSRRHTRPRGDARGKRVSSRGHAEERGGGREDGAAQSAGWQRRYGLQDGHLPEYARAEARDDEELTRRAFAERTEQREKEAAEERARAAAARKRHRVGVLSVEEKEARRVAMAEAAADLGGKRLDMLRRVHAEDAAATADERKDTEEYLRSEEKRTLLASRAVKM